MTGAELILTMVGVVHVARVVGEEVVVWLNKRRTDRLAR